MATPHRLLAAVYTQGPRFAGFEQQVRRRDTHSQEVSLSCLTAAVVAICCLLPSAFYLLSVAQDAQDFLYFLLERAAEELKEASDSASPACLPPFSFQSVRIEMNALKSSRILLSNLSRSR